MEQSWENPRAISLDLKQQRLSKATADLEVSDNQGLLTASLLPVSPQRPSQAGSISPIFPGALKIQLLQTNLGWAMW